MQLLRKALGDHGIIQRDEIMDLSRLASSRCVFVTNALGVAPVRQVNELHLHPDMDFFETVVRAYESVPWEPIEA